MKNNDWELIMKINVGNEKYPKTVEGKKNPSVRKSNVSLVREELKEVSKRTKEEIRVVVGGGGQQETVQ